MRNAPRRVNAASDHRFDSFVNSLCNHALAYAQSCATVRNYEAANLVSIGLGGAISTQGGSLLVNDSDFKGSRIVDAADVWGGAIGSRGGNTVINHSRFDGNQADGKDGCSRGRAVMATTGNTVDIDNSQFIGNSAVGTTVLSGNYPVPTAAAERWLRTVGLV